MLTTLDWPPLQDRLTQKGKTDTEICTSFTVEHQCHPELLIPAESGTKTEVLLILDMTFKTVYN